MSVKIIRHFDYLTGFDEAENDADLAKIMRLKYPQACSGLETEAEFFADMVEQVKKFSAWRVIGFKSFGGFCREKLGRTLSEVEAITEKVRELQSTGATKITLKQVMAHAASKTTGEVLPKHTHPDRQFAHQKQSERAKTNGVSVRTQKKLDKLPPALRARVAAGELSCNAAAIAAGIVKVKTPGQQLVYWWGKASKVERNTFTTEILC